MAKKKFNRSKEIREVLSSGKTDPKEVAQIVSKKIGVEITPQYVSTIKSKLGGADKANKQDIVFVALDFIQSVGGIEKAKHCIQQAEELLDRVKNIKR